MGKDNLELKSLEHGLITFSAKLSQSEIEHFIFFGTLLGIVRDGQPIDGDDDIDFYVNKKNYDEVREIIQEWGFDVDFSVYPNHTRDIIQANGFIDGIEVRVDFYFYNGSSDPNFILERWNFTAEPNNVDNLLKVPKPLIFPLAKIKYQGHEIFIPQYSEIICEFLYGINWKTPQKKGLDYKTIISGGRPLRIKSKGLRPVRSFFDRKYIGVIP